MKIYIPQTLLLSLGALLTAGSVAAKPPAPELTHQQAVLRELRTVAAEVGVDEECPAGLSTSLETVLELSLRERGLTLSSGSHQGVMRLQVDCLDLPEAVVWQVRLGLIEGVRTKRHLESQQFGSGWQVAVTWEVLDFGYIDKLLDPRRVIREQVGEAIATFSNDYLAAQAYDKWRLEAAEGEKKR